MSWQITSDGVGRIAGPGLLSEGTTTLSHKLLSYLHLSANLNLSPRNGT